MTHRFKVLPLIGIAILFWTSLAHADETVSLLNFSANLLGVTQPLGGEVYSGEVNWTPEVSFPFGVAVRAELGAGFLKNVFGDKFLESHYQLFVGYTFLPPVFIEGGVGFETWAGNGGTHTLLSADGGIKLPYFLDRVFVGFSYFFLTGAPAKEYKVGVGFTF